MKKYDGKFFVGIGILLVIAGVLLIPDDQIIGIIGIIFGLYNLYKGIQLLRGIQPLLIRKQQERDKRIHEELRDEIDQKINDNE